MSRLSRMLFCLFVALFVAEAYAYDEAALAAHFNGCPNVAAGDCSYAMLVDNNLAGVDLSGANLTGVYLSYVNLSGANLSGSVLIGVDFFQNNLTGADFTGADFSSAMIYQQDFRGSILENVNFSNADLNEANLSGMDIRTINLTGAAVGGSDLSGADLRGIQLDAVRISSSNLSHAKLVGVDFRQILGGFYEVDFRLADLSMTNLSGVPVADSLFSGANFTGADISSVSFGYFVDFSEVNFTNANLSGSGLDMANFEGAIFFNTNLTNAHFNDANMRGLDLTTAYFSNTSLAGADVSGANLSGVDLTGVSALYGINFSGADLSFANMGWMLIDSVDFRSANLTGAIFERSNLRSVDFRESVLDGSDFFLAYLEAVNMSGVDLRTVSFDRIYIEDSDFSGCNLSNVDLFEFSTYSSNFSGVDMSGSRSYRLTMVGVDLSNANLSEIILEESGFSGDFTNVNFSGSSMVGVGFGDAIFNGAIFDGVNFSEASLLYADFSTAASLKNINFSNAILEGSRLSGGNFQGSMFVGADLSHAWMDGVDLTDVSLLGADVDSVEFTDVIWSNTTCVDGTNSDVHIGGSCLNALDSDGDGVSNLADNCVSVSNANQLNTDGDSEGNACDADDDNDGVTDASDAFPLDASESVDTDGDGTGDNSDPTPNGDTDNDGIDNLSDNCPSVSNSNQLDWDDNGIGDACDAPVPTPEDISGADKAGKAGSAVAFAGDFNGDGYGDYVIGSPNYSLPAAPPAKAIVGAGKAEVISGKNGSVIASVIGVTAKDAMGFAVAGNADIDGDGFADVVVGSPSASVLRVGKVTVLYGGTGNRTHTFWGSMKNMGFGSALALGDVDGDNYADILVGAPNDKNPISSQKAIGSVTVFDGRTQKSRKRFYGKSANAHAGTAIAAGDVDNDGLADIIVGAPDEKGVGSVRVYKHNGTELLQRIGDNKKAQFGKAVASADINHDGYADIVVGAPLNDDAENHIKDAGSISVISGSDGELLSPKSFGAVKKARLGSSVALGDVNGDGTLDIIAGAPQDNNIPTATTNTGSVTVWNGATYTPITTVYGDAKGDLFGAAVSAGDINSDGRVDLIIGIPNKDVELESLVQKDAGGVKVINATLF